MSRCIVRTILCALTLVAGGCAMSEMEPVRQHAPVYVRIAEPLHPDAHVLSITHPGPDPLRAAAEFERRFRKEGFTIVDPPEGDPAAAPPGVGPRHLTILFDYTVRILGEDTTDESAHVFGDFHARVLEVGTGDLVAVGRYDAPLFFARSPEGVLQQFIDGLMGRDRAPETIEAPPPPPPPATPDRPADEIPDRFCPQCGAGVDAEGDNFCRKCGRDLRR